MAPLHIALAQIAPRLGALDENLARHHEEVKDAHLRDLFAADSSRGEALTAEGAGLFLDYSKNRVTPETMRLLSELADAVDLRGRIEAMMRGSILPPHRTRPTFRPANFSG